MQDPVSQKWKKWSMCLYCKKKFSSLKPDKKCAHTGKVPKHGICPCPADVPEDTQKMARNAFKGGVLYEQPENPGFCTRFQGRVVE